MRPVNLLPEDSRVGAKPTGDPLVSYGILGSLVLLLLMVLVTISVSNKAATAQNEADELRAEAGKYKVEAEPVQEFNDFGTEVDKRTLLTAGLSDRRFPWHIALFNLSQTVPRDVTIDSIKAVTASGTQDQAAADPSAAAEEKPGATIELAGCAKDWIPYAKFISRLETMPNVIKVGVNQGGGEGDGGDGAPSDAGADDAIRHENCGSVPLMFKLTVSYRKIAIDLIGLPKIGAPGGATGSTGATTAAPPAAAAVGGQ